MHYASAVGYVVGLVGRGTSVCNVRRSVYVTSRSSTITDKRRITQTQRHNSLGILLQYCD